MSKEFECPLCKSPLSENQYYEIVGVWEEKKKFEENLKKQLTIAKQTREKLLKEKIEIQKKLNKEKIELKKKFEKQREEIIKKAQRQAQLIEKQKVKKELVKLNKEKLELINKQKKALIKAKKEAVEEGKKHEKRRANRLSSMLQRKMLEIQNHAKTIKELKEQLKKGTTPQIEGLNFEQELINELKAKFPNDKFEHLGKGGDILHYILYKNREIGLILYECKKTKKFVKTYVSQIKNDIAKRNATYGVLVTSASEKNKAGFWIDKDILIVHPYGAIYIAEIIRRNLINIFSLKLTESEISVQAKNLLDYIKSDNFKNAVEDTIYRARELNEILGKEMKLHKNIWEKRIKHYNCILGNSSSIEKKSNNILKKEDFKESEKQIEIVVPLLKRRKKQKKKIE